MVSVIIPAHFREKNLKLLLTALEKQSLSKEKFEIIVVTSPQDSSLPLLKSYSGPLSLSFIEAPSAKNVSAKRNLGAKKARYDWLAFTDDDCLPSSEWLQSASQHFNKSTLAIEGLTVTPKTAHNTLTGWGLQRLAQFGGFQTCNMFYQKEEFFRFGGFDEVHFPWYLEDTDMAWNYLEAGKEITSEPKALVEHPVGLAAPWRLLHEAKNSGRKLVLKKKFPRTYRKKSMGVFRPSHWLYLLLEATLLSASLLSLLSPNPLYSQTALFTFLLLLLLHGAHLYKMFAPRKTTTQEVCATSFFTLLSPWFMLYSCTHWWLKMISQKSSD